MNNSNNEGVTFKSSESPVYFAFQNCNKYAIFVHAIKVTTPKPETAGVSDITVSNDERTIYNLAGQKVSTAEKGLYIVNGKKVIK